MKLIVGLGNPGSEYKNTRHNTGFLFLEYIEKKFFVTYWKNELSSLIADTNINGQKIKLVKPQTFMNLSGEALSKIKNYYKIDNEDIIVIYDDVDLEFGSVRYREKGSAGTHNGMRNIVSLCSGENIPRIRIGIGRPKFENQDLADFVLSRFTKEEEEKLQDIFDETFVKLKTFIDK